MFNAGSTSEAAVQFVERRLHLRPLLGDALTVLYRATTISKEDRSMPALSKRELVQTALGSLVLASCGKGIAQGEAGRGAVRAGLYNCEGCEAVFERNAASLNADVDIARGEEGEAMILEGIVRMPDGQTPAPGVIIYLHQTNVDGLYANGTNENEWSRRHGHLRGWAVTGADGRYRFRTIKPAPYPDMTMPAHIHLMIGEPGKRPYYIDDVVFDGEFKVDAKYRAAQEFRGGGGIVKLSRDGDGRWLAVRDIILERHP
jgi:protocatechuate 3,4-dioxygenase beta subunit